MIIGITGGIGSGKSTIAKQLREMGYMVYDTDSEAKRLIVEDTHVRQQIEQLFGSEVYKDGIYQTALVAKRVFADHSLLAKLNAIVHPAVKADIMNRVSRLASQESQVGNQKNLFFIECAILYQAGFDTLCDKVVAVTAPEEIRLARAVARDHSTIEKVRARIHAQEAEKDVKRADIVINNDGQTPILTLCEEILQFIQ
ncbi:MAG: dephospho-CoA kinase [Paludibacteraceae bacterium]|nr:dephospho-CoA kinase [Paludibacteraceae bacterium]